MSTMNILSVTLIVLILAAIAALFVGMRTAQADEAYVPVFGPVQSVEAISTLDAMDEVAAPITVH